MAIRVEEYIRLDGSIPYKDWFDRLDPQAAAKATTAKLRMELGNTSNVKWYAGIGQQVDIDRAQALHAEYKARKAPPPVGDKAKKRKR